MRKKRNNGPDRKNSLAIWVWTSLLVALLSALAAPAYSQNRVVAIGDVHGAHAELVSILQRTGLIDGNSNWIGGSTTLVQTGDLLDRGRQSRDCLNLLIKIEVQAKKQGGKVIPLLGNHEMLNILGDLRYVTADIYRTFATSRSGKLHENAYQDYLKFLSTHREHSHTKIPGDDGGLRQKWEKDHPIGFFEYRDSFGPGGKYGAWLRAHTAIVKVEDGLYVHGGLNPRLQFRNIAEINDRIRSEITAFDSLWRSLVDRKVIWRYMSFEEAVRHVDEELKWMVEHGGVENSELVPQMRQLLGINNWLITSEKGPLWYRGLAQGPEGELSDALTAMLTQLNAHYIVAGHTVVSKSALTTRFDNCVFLIDVGMLKEFYGGRSSALEIEKSQFTAVYADGERQILSGPGCKVARSPASESRGKK